MHIINIDDIKKLFSEEKIIWSQHMVIRIQKRGITYDDIKNCVYTGEIIEHYQSDYPYPSYLIFGLTLRNEILHVVCGIGQEKLWMITAYYPDNEEWFEDFKTRRR